MRTKLVLFLFLIFYASCSLFAQTAEEIVAKYFENTGGIENWQALNGMLSYAIVNDQEMEIPYSRIALKDGRQILKFKLQGKEIIQQAFDGTVAWGTNFISMEPEERNDETTENIRREAGNFPHPLLNYKELGYSIELINDRSSDSTSLSIIKLTRKPKLVGGEDVDNVLFYYFDSTTFLLVAMESEIKSGKMQGNIDRTTYSNYQEIGGLKFPFSLSKGIKDMDMRTIIIESIELNPDITEATFMFPINEKSKK